MSSAHVVAPVHWPSASAAASPTWLSMQQYHDPAVFRQSCIKRASKCGAEQSTQTYAQYRNKHTMDGWMHSHTQRMYTNECAKGRKALAYRRRGTRTYSKSRCTNAAQGASSSISHCTHLSSYTQSLTYCTLVHIDTSKTFCPTKNTTRNDTLHQSISKRRLVSW